MKYVIALLCISNCIHTGPFWSRTQQRLPLRYIYVTPTLESKDETQLFSGNYSYVYWNDGKCGSAQSPVWPKPKDNDAYMVQIKSVVFSPQELPKQLSILYAIIKIAPNGTTSTETEDSLGIDLATGNQKQTHTIPHESQILKLLIEQKMIVHK